MGLGEFTTHVRTDFSGWIGGTIWLLTHGHLEVREFKGKCCGALDDPTPEAEQDAAYRLIEEPELIFSKHASSRHSLRVPFCLVVLHGAAAFLILYMVLGSPFL